jgi:hypothetical protein
MPCRWLLSISMAASIAACSLPLDEPLQVADPDPSVAQAAAGLQLAYTPGVHLADARFNRSLARMVAALRLTNVEPTMPVASCGLTWVSHHYGVTAAHCVKHLGIRERRLTVEEVIVEQLDPVQTANYMTVLGSWSTGFQPAGQLTTGYATRRYTDCYVSRRCGTDDIGGRQGCPIAETVDIALVKCPNRDFSEHADTTSALLPSNPVDIDDQVTLPVNTWWFHEVYNLPTEDDGTDRWHNYGKYLGKTQANQNWHYTREHQLLPLVSIFYPNGTPYSTVPSLRAVLNDMDTPICHGTSGSGVFIFGTNILLGPAISAGSNSQISDRLCEPADRAVPGTSLTTYVRGAITDAFVRNSPEVATDF